MDAGTAGDPFDVTILLLPGVSLMSTASLIDPLRAANRVAGRAAFTWRVATPDGAPIETSCGLPLMPTAPFEPRRRTDLFAVVAGFGADLAGPEVLANVALAARSARLLGGVEAGAWLLARAGLLGGRVATTHWEDLAPFAEAFPGVEVVSDRYVQDGRVFTTGGASPTFDLMLDLVRRRHGVATALDVAGIFIYEQAQAGRAAQRLVSLGRAGAVDRRLVPVIRAMEAGIEAPPTIAAIAKRCGVTRRTLDHLFDRAIGETPGAYFLRLRLGAADRLLRDTRAPLAEIAARTGFSSASTFSRAYRRAYDRPPSAAREEAGR